GRASRVEIPGPQGARESEAMGQEAQVVRRGVAVVERHGVAAVLAADSGEALPGELERVVPAGLVERSVALHERPAQAVGVVVEVGEGGRLRADEALALRVVPIAAD